jgi:hypothetical protein
VLVTSVDLDVGIGVVLGGLRSVNPRDVKVQDGGAVGKADLARYCHGASSAHFSGAGTAAFSCETVRYLRTLASQPARVSGPGDADPDDRRATGGSEAAFRQREYLALSVELDAFSAHAA